LVESQSQKVYGEWLRARERRKTEKDGGGNREGPGGGGTRKKMEKRTEVCGGDQDIPKGELMGKVS